MKDKLTIYWASCNEVAREINKSLWYTEPQNVYKRHAKNKNYEIPEGGTTMFMCPAVQDTLKKIWSFHNVVDTKIKIKDGAIVYHHGIPLHPTPRQNSIRNAGHVWFDLGWLFFSSSPVRATFTSPYFDNYSYLSQASLPPATFDIGRWFRPFNAEFIAWNTIDSEFNIKPEEAIFYLNLDTNKKVEFVRFEQTDKLIEYATGCSKSTQFLGRGTSLEKRYTNFENARLKKMVMREIRKNIL